jgi:hypothetical protein
LHKQEKSVILAIESDISMAKIRHDISHQADIILTKALKNAADYWSVSNKQLGDIIGVSEATISRLKNNHYSLDPHSKQGQLAVIFLRIFRGLDAYMGGHIENERAWLTSHNTALGGAPLDVMRNVEGLSHVVQYIDCMRGQS